MEKLLSQKCGGWSEKNKDKDINFEDILWKAADKLRKKIEVHEYKDVVLGLIFLRYVSYALEERKKELQKNFSNPKSKEYIESEKFRKKALEEGYRETFIRSLFKE